MKHKKLVWLIVLLGCLFLNSICSAQYVTGRAYIENNNLQKAREEARREALRSFVEERIGVRINSKTETENFLLLRDYITARSEGYVVVKKVVSEKIEDSCLVLLLDLEVGNKPLELAEQEIKTQLQNLDRNSSRGSLEIAMFDVDADKSWDWSRYMVGALRKHGFARIKSNDMVLKYLSDNLMEDKLKLYTHLRQVGKNSGSTAKAILRGSLKTIDQGTQVALGAYKATAMVSLEIIGYESDNIDAMTRYVSAVGTSKADAEIRAKEKALEEAAEVLAQQASVTVQYEEQGGRREIELSLVFPDAYNQGTDSKLILQALEASECEIDRSVFASDGSFRVAIYSQSYEKVNDLLRRVLEELQLNYPNVSRIENIITGDSKIVIRLR